MPGIILPSTSIAGGVKAGDGGSVSRTGGGSSGAAPSGRSGVAGVSSPSSVPKVGAVGMTDACGAAP